MRRCPECEDANHTLARFCRQCRHPFSETLEDALTLAGLAKIWQNAVNEREQDVSSLSLSPTGGRVSAISFFCGFLFIGTNQGDVFVLNSRDPSTPLASKKLNGQVLAFDTPNADPSGFESPWVLVSTTSELVQLSLLPEMDWKTIWKPEGNEALLCPAVRLFPGVVFLRSVESGGGELVFLDLREEPPLALSLEVLVRSGESVPTRLGSRGVVLADESRLFVVSFGSRPEVSISETAYRIESGNPPALVGSGEEPDLVLVHRLQDHRGLLRFVFDRKWTATSFSLEDHGYASPKVATGLDGEVVVGHERGISIHEAFTGRLRWSMKGDLQIDTLKVERFPPITKGSFAFFVASDRTGRDSLEILSIEKSGLNRGLFSLAFPKHSSAPPLAIPGGVVIPTASDSGKGPTLLWVKVPSDH